MDSDLQSIGNQFLKVMNGESSVASSPPEEQGKVSIRELLGSFSGLVKGAPGLNIHLMPLKIVDQLFQTSALDAESWPPFAKLVSMAGYGCLSKRVTS